MNMIKQAKIAIRNGHLPEARRLLRQILRDDPQNYIAWLLLARATPSPQAARAYILRAEALQPNNTLVKRELLRLDQQNKITVAVPVEGWRWGPYLLVSGVLAVLLLLIAWLAPLGWERVMALKETGSTEVAAPPAVITPITVPTWVVTVTEEPTLQPTPTLMPVTVEASPAAEEIPEEIAAVSTPEVIQETDVLGLEADPELETELLPDAEMNESSGEEEITDAVEEVVVSDSSDVTPPTEEIITAEPLETAPVANASSIRPNGVGPTERWIDVNLYTQTLVAYEGDAPVFNSLISSGLWNTPTVTGQFRTNMKYESQDMNGYALGYDYYLQDVPYVMYFFKDYAIHGAYWHNNFGSPMSHGCVNMNPVDAGWLFNWAPVGTMVNIHN